MKECPKRPKKKFECNHCANSYTQKRKLLKHKAHVHDIWPDGHWVEFRKTYVCPNPKCSKVVPCGYRKSKYKDHCDTCTKGCETEECNKCGNIVYVGMKHKCTIPKVTGLQHKRTLEQKFFMLAEFEHYTAAGPMQRALYLRKVGARGVTEKLQSNFSARIVSLDHSI